MFLDSGAPPEPSHVNGYVGIGSAVHVSTLRGYTKDNISTEVGLDGLFLSDYIRVDSFVGIRKG